MDAEDESLKRDSVAAFKQEIAWASHLSMSAVVLPTPCAMPYNYAHNLVETLHQSHWAQFMVKVPMVSRKMQLCETDAELAAVTSQKSHLGRPLHDSWEWWNTLREMCDHHNNLTVALELTADLPSAEVSFFFFFCFLVTRIICYDGQI